jgi:hypothetical protein
MTRAGLNLVSSVFSLLGAFILLAAVRTPSALIWFGASVVWLMLTFLGQRKSEKLQFPGHRMLRRVSRLLLFS